MEVSPPFSFSWTDDVHQNLSLHGLPYPSTDLDGMIMMDQVESVQESPQSSLPTGSQWQQEAIDKGKHDLTVDEPSTKESDSRRLPRHLLAQHFAQKLTGRYSFKSSQWTYHTYFFHRFTNTHSWVLSAMLAWTSANLFYNEKVESLDTACSHYQESLAQISECSGRDLDEVSKSWPATNHQEHNRKLAEAETDDIDAIFVACFYLALHDLITARPYQVRKILRFIAHVLKVPNVWQAMGGIRSRVALWVRVPSSHSLLISPDRHLVLPPGW